MKYLFALVCTLLSSQLLAESAETSTRKVDTYALAALVVMGVIGLVLARRKNEAPQS